MNRVVAQCAVVAFTGMVLGGVPAPAYSAELWVTKAGNDRNNCSDRSGNSCLTIQKALSLAKPGDSVFVGKGTYVEDSSRSSYTQKCSWLGDIVASLCLKTSGLPDKRILLAAVPGDEGAVVIDSESKRVGIHTEAYDYITISGLVLINSRVIGIASWGQVQNEIPDENLLGVGLIIENNRFYNTTGREGMNTSAIGMWGSKDWVVRNNFIDGVSAEGSTLAAGIQSYGVINALVEHNEIYNADFGIFWKDHFIQDSSRRHFFESEIRYNVINASVHGIQFGVRGSSTVAAGDNYIHHNIVYGYSGSAIFGNMAAAKGLSGWIRIEHNLFDGEGKRGNSAITLDAQSPAFIKGNILLGSDLDLDIKKYSSTKFTVIEDLSFNVYDESFQAIIDRYSDSSRGTRSLASWQGFDSSISKSIKTSLDRNSIQAAPNELLENRAVKTYKLAAESPARSFMSDGSNAGPYQFGDEVIGLTTEAYTGGRPTGVQSVQPIAPPAIRID